MSNLSPVKLAPAFKDYLWGGTKLYVEAIGKEALGEKAIEVSKLTKAPELKNEEGDVFGILPILYCQKGNGKGKYNIKNRRKLIC